MSFNRLPADNWHRDIPGARWFKADLHIHTIDDRDGGRAKMPPGLSGNPEDPEVLSEYARRFLRSVVGSGVQILGLTPHSPRVGATPDTSAVWRIVDEWNTGVDEDGTLFREKIYAVFPGFEPNVHDGGGGTHLLFLFDPEIGRDRYCRLFDAIMNGRSPWVDGKLRMTTRRAEDVFQTLDQHRQESHESDSPWDYVALAPHPQGEHGLLRELKKQVLEEFPCERLAGYELGDNQVPGDFDESRKPGSFLLPFMREHRQILFHASDSYSPDQVGYRHTWIKLASPYIEALRQAFIASDSRVRIGFHRNRHGELEEIADPPDVTLTDRPWLKSVTIKGRGASFFGSHNAGSPEVFHFSPDLTCIIGGSMTGKSTLLDGLRVHIGVKLPDEKIIREEVEKRGRSLFLAGSPDVVLDCPGSDPTAPPCRQWPAVFFAQSELRDLAKRPEAVESILARLVPSEKDEIESRAARLAGLDGELATLARRLAELDEQVGDATQAEKRARRAREELDALAEAGVDQLHRAGRDHRSWREGHQRAADLHGQLIELLSAVASFEAPEVGKELAERLRREEIDSADLKVGLEEVISNLANAAEKLTEWLAEAERITELVGTREAEVRIEVERRLAAEGFDASRLREFQALHQQASLLSSYEANRKESEQRLVGSERRFEELREERRKLVAEQRDAFDRVAAQIESDFEGGILVQRKECGDTAQLEALLYGLAQRGVSRWWNDLDSDKRPDPQCLLEALREDQLGDWRMSEAVQATFRETMTRARRWELAAIRCPDRYHLQLRLEDGSARRLDQLSGGQRVSLLLSLLLKTADVRPLVIDQPEDELDSRFLFRTVLPALKKLKGRRQVIVATHNANIVVNGDADMVVQLEATAHHGRVGCSGAIEKPAVRNAIVRTVDGGRQAFRLRRLKYGF